ncbi:MAG: hypothetical protein AAB927_03710 [Patescibacteria group bacterium]
MAPSISQVDAEQRVAEGVKFLDRIRPNWRERIMHKDACALVMADPERCVASLVEGTTFYMALKSLGINHEQAIAYGFLRSHNDPNTFYGDLQHCWMQQVRT